MGELTALLASSSSAPIDWVYGAAASIVFVAVIAIPAAFLNVRDRKRRAQERSSAQSAR
jgi:ABC-type spermidine/putrescine transport system permease subunit I